MLMAEFVTCVKYQLPVKVVIVKNNTLAMTKWEQMVFLGNPEYGCELRRGRVDPFEPPMPPKITLDQATKFTQSLIRGEPSRGKIALTVLSDKVRELI